MRLLLLGPPGSGKGTQAQLLHQRLGLETIGMGHLLRRAVEQQTPAGRKAKSYMAQGQLVPDEIVNQMVAERFLADNAPAQFVMDGYPRNTLQAIAFDELLADLALDLHLAVELTMDDATLIARLSGRRSCPQCQTVYHLNHNPPRSAGRCDRDGAELQQRSDDNEETVRSRLLVYQHTITKLLNHYRAQNKLKRIDSDKEIEDVYQELAKMLQENESGC